MKKKKVLVKVSKSKYNIDQSSDGKAQRTYNNKIFDSVLEKNYYIYLLDLQAEGLVESIERQPKFLLFDGYVRKCDGKKILPVFYIADFSVRYFDNNKIVVYDVKGNPDSMALLKKKVFEGLYPDINFCWVSWSKQDGGWLEYDELVLARKQRKKDKVKK